jgi:small subunit ribosomal protein S4
MSRYLGAICKLCRREREKLFLKGKRCSTSTCVMNKSKGKTVPGQHNMFFRNKISDYALHLREKQKAKRLYGVTEHQFSNYYKNAEKMHGATGSNLLKLLESRLDNVVFKLKFALSKRMARQIVNHGQILVNGKRLDIPSYQVKVGDVITLSEKYKPIAIKNASEIHTSNIPSWLSYDETNFVGTVISEPSLDELLNAINSKLIVEYYSK